MHTGLVRLLWFIFGLVFLVVVGVVVVDVGVILPVVRKRKSTTFTNLQQLVLQAALPYLPKTSYCARLYNNYDQAYFLVGMDFEPVPFPTTTTESSCRGGGADGSR